MNREQQKAQVQMALELLRLLRENRQREMGLDLERQKMEQEARMSMMQNRLKRQELAQSAEQGRLDRETTLKAAEVRNQGLLDPQIMDYLQKAMTLPAGPERDALLTNLERLTGKSFDRPIDPFKQLLNKKL